jgi:hypothetical protein
MKLFRRCSRLRGHFLVAGAAISLLTQPAVAGQPIDKQARKQSGKRHSSAQNPGNPWGVFKAPTAGTAGTAATTSGGQSTVAVDEFGRRWVNGQLVPTGQTTGGGSSGSNPISTYSTSPSGSGKPTGSTTTTTKPPRHWPTFGGGSTPGGFGGFSQGGQGGSTRGGSSHGGSTHGGSTHGGSGWSGFGGFGQGGSSAGPGGGQIVTPNSVPTQTGGTGVLVTRNAVPQTTPVVPPITNVVPEITPVQQPPANTLPEATPVADNALPPAIPANKFDPSRAVDDPLVTVRCAFTGCERQVRRSVAMAAGADVAPSL